MSPTRRWGRAAPLLAGAGLLLASATEIGRVLGVFRPNEDPLLLTTALWLAMVGWGGVGALIGLRRPHNAIGLVLAGEAALIGAAIFLDEIGRVADGLPLDLGRASDWILIPILLAVPLLLTLFPTGRPLSRRWNLALWLLLASLASGTLGFFIEPGGWNALRSALLSAAGVTGLSGAALAIASVVVRFRRSRGEERPQLRWLVYAAALGGVLIVAGWVAEITGGERSFAAEVVSYLLLGILTVAIPITIGIAILKYRLYDIDVVIRKTVVFGVLAAFITLVYVGLVVGIGALIGSGRNVALSGLAAAIVAVAFQPMRLRARRLANHLVYGKRATPYEVLSDFSGRLAGSYSLEDVLPRTAQVLAEGTGASRGTIWIVSRGSYRDAATWPSDADPAPLEPAFEVRHQGERLGAISIAMPPGEPLTPVHERLIRDVAAQAGLILRNVRLLEELRESRRRIVAAQDERAKKLERNLHDGAQQQLVALAVKLRLAEQLADRDPAKTKVMLTELQAETDDALQNLRDLARGIYPPLLADSGLPTALEAQARRSPVPAEVQADGVGRYPQEAEAAVYFCVLEALQNVAKYSEASRVVVRLSDGEGELAFEVADDGLGFDPDSTPRGSGLQNIADRLSALGGSLEVRSRPGLGTTVAGRVPVKVAR